MRRQKRTFRHIYVIFKIYEELHDRLLLIKYVLTKNGRKVRKKKPLKNKNETAPTIDILSMVLKNNMHVSKMF